MIFPTPIPFRELPECDDDDLICQIEKLYQAYAAEIWQILYRRFGDAERANDAVHEAFLRLYTFGIDKVEYPKAWMVRTGTNFLIDAERRAQYHVECENLLMQMADEALPADDPEAAESRQLLHDAVETLNEADQEVLRLRYGQQMRSADIGRKLGISPAAVDMRLTRARRRLEDVLESLGLDEKQLL